MSFWDVIFCKFTYLSENHAPVLFSLRREEKFILNFGKFSQGTNLRGPADRILHRHRHGNVKFLATWTTRKYS